MLNVALFGVGKWAHGGWLQTLLDAAEEDLVTLYVVDLKPRIPSHIAEDPRARLATYVPSPQQDGLPPLDLAVISVPAKRHRDCLLELLPLVRTGGSVVCEKPGGDTLLDYVDMWDACRRRGVDFVVSDHYLVRPNLQQVLEDQHEPLSTQHRIRRIRAYMQERKATGPDQDSDLDMAVHMINVLHVLLPGKAYLPQVARFGAATTHAHVDITYAITQGELVGNGDTMGCQIEVGKQMPRDRKEIILETDSRSLHIDLRNAPHWRYGRILRDIVDGKRLSCGTGRSGAVPPHIALRTWISMTRARLCAAHIPPYEPQTSPDLGTLKRWPDPQPPSAASP